MKIRKFIFLSFSHISTLVLGFVIGIYIFPILISPTSPSASDIVAVSIQADYNAHFTRNLKGSDFLHWGDGKVSISANYVTLLGKLAPGPEYKLYLSPEFIETEAQFESLKSTMKLVGDVKTFDNFVVKVEPNINISQFNTVVIWCEAFGQFITSAKYR